MKNSLIFFAKVTYQLNLFFIPIVSEIFLIKNIYLLQLYILSSIMATSINVLKKRLYYNDCENLFKKMNNTMFPLKSVS